MGKTKREARKVHTNHHDNPRHKSNRIVRRSHSQTVSKKSGSSKLEAPCAVVKAVARHRVPFNESDRVLCVGEGDFSFALSLAARHNVRHIMATCYDDKDTLHRKYPQARQIVLQLLSMNLANLEPPAREEDELEWQGLSPSPPGWDAGFPEILSQPTEAKTSRSQSSITSNAHTSVHYCVNATRLSSTHSKLFRLKSPFSKIVFNFPHVGGISTDVNRQVRANQELLVGFFKAAIPLLASAERPVQIEWGHDGGGDHRYSDEIDEEGNFSELHFEKNEKPVIGKGQILVTLFEGEPYTLWNIRDLARHSGLKVAESFRFPWEAYTGYAHSRTLGEITKGKDRTAEGKRKGAWRGEEREARCFVLEVKDEGGNTSGKSVGTDGNNVDLGTRRRKRKRMAGETESDGGSD